MTQALIVLCLAVAAAVVVMSALGVLTLDNVFDRLHYVGPAGTIAPGAVALAVLLSDGLSSAAVKSFLVAGVLLVTGPAAAHITARAARVRQVGHSDPLPAEERIDLRRRGRQGTGEGT